MGIIDKIKHRLPIVGAGGEAASPAPSPAPSAATRPPVAASASGEAVRGDRDAQQFIDETVKSHPVVLFMKGSPRSPMCGFSANAAGILMSYGVDITHVDVLRDPDVRQGVKDYSQWPTIPQVYVGGEFLGGSDILMDMHHNGELKKALDATRA